MLEVSCEITLRWLSLDLNNNRHWFRVLAWCRQVTSHYLSRCSPCSMLSYGFTRPQWVNLLRNEKIGFNIPQNVNFLRALLAICQCWFRYWLGGNHLLNQYLNRMMTTYQVQQCVQFNSRSSRAHHCIYLDWSNDSDISRLCMGWSYDFEVSWMHNVLKTLSTTLINEWLEQLYHNWLILCLHILCCLSTLNHQQKQS